MSDKSSFTYLLAVIGSAVYYIQQASTFWEGAFGIIKALLWPAVLAYKALQFFN